MSFSVLISSLNYNNRVGTITFNPTTGGTISLGSQTIPYTYESNYPFGTYNIYFPYFDNTCNTIIDPPTYATLIKAKAKGCTVYGSTETLIGQYRINGGPWTSMAGLNSVQTTYITLASLTYPYGTIIDVCYPNAYFGVGYIPTVAGAGDYNSSYGYGYNRIIVTSDKSYFYNLDTETQTIPCCVDGTTTIGTQTWTCQNLTVTNYRNGNTIPQVTNDTTWSTLTTGAWCYHNNDPATEAVYGKLYNFAAINDSRGLAPNGYHIPTDTEWTVLTNYLGGLSVAGGKMKEEGTTHWTSPNAGATNESCFTALPGSFRYNYGGFGGIGLGGNWWSSTVNNTTSSWGYVIYNTTSSVTRAALPKQYGLSVRLIKD